jgi:hypothetical protein
MDIMETKGAKQIPQGLSMLFQQTPTPLRTHLHKNTSQNVMQPASIPNLITNKRCLGTL